MTPEQIKQTQGKIIALTERLEDKQLMLDKLIIDIKQLNNKISKLTKAVQK